MLLAATETSAVADEEALHTLLHIRARLWPANRSAGGAAWPTRAREPRPKQGADAANTDTAIWGASVSYRVSA